MDAAWHMDDYGNILYNPKIQINSLNPSSIRETFFANIDQPGKLYRPVAVFSLALNWYLGQKSVFGYHVVNLIIHLITALFLYFTIVILQNTPILESEDQKSKALVALLATLLWALNPIQTQAVTYIVQRMASMAAMFYVIAMYCYLRGRSAKQPAPRFVSYTLCIFSFLMAILSKENAVMLPASIILVEWIFFSNKTLEVNFKRIYQYIAFGTIISLVAIVVTYFFVYEKNLAFIVDGFSGRPFTLKERLLTEFRVIVYYISQIFYPLPNRLSLLHDVQLSTTLFSPITTLFSILFIVALTIISLIIKKKLPIISFAVLFFLINHIVESTILPLEIVYEHRNYLPSLFLFFPIAYYCVKFIDSCRRTQKKALSIIMTVGISSVVVLFGFGTYTRNMVWQTEKSLWAYEIEKNPGLSRPYVAYAYGYLQPTGQNEKAIEYYQKALRLQQFSDSEELLLRSYLAQAYYLIEDYRTSITIFDNLLKERPDFYKARMQLSMALIQTEQFEKAFNTLNELPKEQANYADADHLRGVILVNQGRYEDAIQQFATNIQKGHETQKAIIFLGALHSILHNYDMGWKIYSSLEQDKGMVPIVLLGKADNKIKCQDIESADRLLREFIDTVGLASVIPILTKLETDRLSVPLDYKTILHRMTFLMANGQ